MAALQRAFRRIGMTARLLVAVGITGLAGGVVLLGALLAAEAARLQSDLEQRAADEVAAIVPLIADQAIVGDYALIQRLLDVRAHNPHVESVAWTDHRGATLRKDDPSPAAAAPAWFAALSGVVAVERQEPLHVGGRSYGRLTVQMSAVQSVDHLWRILRTGSAILAAALVVNLVLVFVLLHLGLAPLAALNQGTRRLGGGDYGVRVAVAGPPEMRTTIEAFNHAAAMIGDLHDSLRAQQAALEEGRGQLEARVAERTAELWSKNHQLEHESARRNSLLAELRASEERFRTLTALSTDWFWEQDAELRFVQITEGSHDCGGIAREAHAGKTRWELPYTEIAGGDWGPHRAALARREPFRDLLLRRALPGDEHWILVSGAPRFAADGTFSGYLGVGRDVTHAKRAELALIAARDAADAASRAKSEFLANMSHEVRTPMNGVLGLAGMLLESSMPRREHDLVRTMQRSTLALLKVINDVLDFSKIEASRLDLDEDDFEVRALLDETLRSFAAAAREAGIRLGGTVGAAVPAFARGDPCRLRQVVSNLVANAIKFSREGAVDVAVDVVAGEGEGEGEALVLEFVVRDSGIGIAAADLERIFEPFTQADGSAARRYGGTGLGLTISRRLVQMMGGTIVASSAPGVGTTLRFTVRLRQAVGHDAAAGAAAELPPRLHGRVLLAEDNEVNRLVAVSMLEDLGLEVDVAADGREAVALAGHRGYDVVLMDCQMPEVDGFAATAEIRSREHAAGASPCPIVAVTAHAMQGDRERCLASGMNDHLAKPYERHELARVLGRWLPRAATAMAEAAA